MKRTLRFLATAGALAVALTLVLAACGGSDDSDGVASLTDTTEQSDGSEGSGDNGSTTPSQEDREEAALAFARCMREHGVDFPDPVNGRFEFRSTPGDQADQEKMQEAQEACQHLLDDAAPPLDDEQQAEMREAALDFARCMREHGVDMPDPQFQGGGTLMRMPEGAEDDPDFEEAQQACQPILDEARPEASPDQGEDS